MKWKAGPSPHEQEMVRIAKMKQWHTWFAWYPVTIGDNQVWLETILRQGSVHSVSDSGRAYFDYEYRLPGVQYE